MLEMKRPIIEYVTIVMLILSLTGSLSTAVCSTEIKVPIDYKTIQEAIDAAKPGDIVRIASGLYNESIVIVNKTDLMIVGEDVANTIIDGSGCDGSLIEICSAKNITIANLTIQNSGGHGIFIEKSEGITVLNNVFYNCKQAIWLGHSSGNRIEKNRIEQCSTGIGLTINSTSNIVEENEIRANNIGITITAYADGNIISKNSITNSQIGIKISLSVGNVVSENVIAGHKQYGIYIYGIRASSNNFTLNIVENNEIGVYIYQSHGNFFYCNNFIDNTVQVYLTGDEINYWSYHEKGNYWSDYTGVDEDGDGIGEIPYEINEKNKDYYPFARKSGWTPQMRGFQINIYVILIIAVAAIVYIGTLIFFKMKTRKKLKSLELKGNIKFSSFFSILFFYVSSIKYMSQLLSKELQLRRLQ